MSVSVIDRSCPIEYFPWEKNELPNAVSPLGETVKRWEIIDTRTQLHYRGVSPPQISFISLILVAWTPVYTLALMAFSGLRTLGRIAKLIYEIFERIWNGKDCRLEELSKKSLSVFIFVGKGMWDVVSAPFYGIGLSFSAVLGVFVPYEGRKYFSMIENHWHSGASYRNDIRRIHSQDNPITKILWDSLTDPEAPHVFYLAYCFQPLERGDS